MARKAFFAFLVLFSFAFCEAKAENCSEVQCKIFLVGEDLASEFRLKASEKGVRLVYINLMIGNATYDPLDLPDEFLPHRWVWANTIKEPMLTMPDDYDILSFGLLNYQVRSMDVKLEDQPSGCLANLNSTCQNMAVGRMLLENVTIKSTGEQVRMKPVVCVKVITTDDFYAGIPMRDINHHQCCGMHQEPTGSAIIRCDQTVDIDYWMEAVDVFFAIFSGILSLFLPALPLALPDCVFSLRAECEKEKRLEEQNNNTGTPGDHQNINGTTDEPDNPSADELSLRNRHGSYPQQISDSDHDASNPRENISEQIEEESETIPVDDSSPMNLSTLLNGCVQKLPDIEMSFNIKLAILLLCICPSVLYVHIGLQRTVKTMYVNEMIKKDVAHLPVSGLSVLVIIILFIYVLILRPRDFIFEKVITCMVCGEKSDRLSVGDKIRCHLKTLNHHLWEYIHCFGDVVVCDKCICPNSCRKMRQKSQLLRHLDQVTVACGKYVCPNSCRKIVRRKSQLLQLICNFGDVVTVCSKCICLYAYRKRRQKSRLIQLICVFLRLICFPTALLLRILFGAIFFVVLLFVSVVEVVSLSPLMTLFAFLLTKVKIYYLALDRRPVSALFAGSLAFLYFCFFGSTLYVGYSMIAFSTVCINNVLGYTIMGFVLNVDIVTPYVAFFVVLTTNLYLCYSNMQSKYKKVKRMILKWKEDLQVNSRDIKNTIQVQLYWHVCDKVLPIKTEICVMFRNMSLVLLFLFLVAYSIAFFGKEYDVSFVTSTVYVFFSGAIPPLVLRRLTHSDKINGWTKIKMERQIGIAVKEYRNSSDAGVVTQSPV